MKKKSSWKTIAGLTAAAAAWVKLSEDLPVDELIGPPQPVCEYPYTNLTYIQIQTKLNGLESDLEKKRISLEYYAKERAKLLVCRGLF